VIRAVDDAGTFDWGCTLCGTEHRGWVIDPAKGQLIVADGCFAVVCPCGSVTNYHRGLRPVQNGARLAITWDAHIGTGCALCILRLFVLFMGFNYRATYSVSIRLLVFSLYIVVHSKLVLGISAGLPPAI
jgi:hypothetical protein